MSKERTLPPIGSWVPCRSCGCTCTVFNETTRRWECERCPPLSSGSSDATDTDQESVAWSRYASASPTPFVSAASTPTLARGQLTGPTRQGRRTRTNAQSRGSLCPACNTHNCTNSRHRTQRKNCQERANRGDLQEITQLMQDVVLNYAYGDGSTPPGKVQSANNAHSSGLVYKKFDAMRDAMALLISNLQDGLEVASKKAIISGDDSHVAEFYARQKAYIQNAREAEDPRAGSFLKSCERKCAPARDDDKRCVVHNISEWAKCRANRIRMGFQNRYAEFMSTLRGKLRM